MSGRPAGQFPRRRAADRRNARLYLVGLGASMVGTSAMTLVAGIWVKSLTGSSSAAALVSVCIYAPSLLGPLAGMAADRVRRRPLLLAVNLASTVLVLALLLVDAFDLVWLIFVVMVGYGVSMVLIDPAENALFAIMLPADVRQRVNGIRLTLQEGGKLIAPLLGAGLFAILGGGSVAALDAATFLIAALMIAQLRVSEPSPEPGHRPWRTELVAGLGFIRRTVDVRTTMMAAAVAMAVSGVVVAAQYSLVDALGRPPSFLGLLTGAVGAGSIIAGLSSSWVIRHGGERRLAVLGLLNGTIGYLLRATGWLPAALVGSFILGFALPWAVIAVINLVQRRAPDVLQGRVAAAATFALFAPQPLAQAAGAAAISHTSYRVLYCIAAALNIGAAAYLCLRSPGPNAEPSDTK